MKYLFLYFAFFHRYLMKAIEYRLNFLIWTFLNLFWLAISFLTVVLIFRQTESIAGWKRDEVLILVLVWMIFFDVISIFVRPSLRHLSRRLIRRGDLDFVLLRPVSSRFLASVQDFDIDELSRLVVSSFALVFFLRFMGTTVSLWSWFNFGLIFVAAAVIFYSFLFSLTTLNFWFINLFNLDDLFDRFLNMGQFPVDIFGKNFRAVFIYLIPVAFAGYFQTKALLGQIGLEGVVLAGLMAIISLAASQLFWSLALKHYSSASS